MEVAQSVLGLWDSWFWNEERSGALRTAGRQEVALYVNWKYWVQRAVLLRFCLLCMQPFWVMMTFLFSYQWKVFPMADKEALSFCHHFQPATQELSHKYAQLFTDHNFHWSLEPSSLGWAAPSVPPETLNYLEEWGFKSSAILVQRNKHPRRVILRIIDIRPHIFSLSHGNRCTFRNSEEGNWRNLTS